MLNVTGQGSLNVTGKIYAPGAVVQVSGGNLTLEGSATGLFGAALISDDLRVSASGDVLVDTSDNDL
jgi:hypothetical protein